MSQPRMKTSKRQPLRKAATEKKVEKRGRTANDAINEQAQSKKQRALPTEKDDDEDTENGEEDNDDDQEEENVQGQQTQDYTFEFNDMKEDYSPGIKLILAATLIANPSKAYHLSDEIVKQDTVGTIVACEGENDVFAFATIMPSKLLKDSEFLQNIQQHFISKGDEIPGNVRKIFQRLQNDQGKCEIGFLIHGRFSNAPLELVSQVHNNLLLDYEWSLNQKLGKTRTDDVDVEMIQMFHQLKYLVVITPASCETEISSTVNVRGRSDIFFDNFEDECYFGHATDAFLVKFGNTFFKPASCCVMIVPVENFKKCVADVMKLTN